MNFAIVVFFKFWIVLRPFRATCRCDPCVFADVLNRLLKIVCRCMRTYAENWWIV